MKKLESKQTNTNVISIARILLICNDFEVPKSRENAPVVWKGTSI